MLNSPAVQIMLLFGVIIASGLLLTLINDLVIGSQTRSNPGRRVGATRGRRSSTQTYAGVAPAKKSYATVNALRVPAAPTAASNDNRDFKVITVRMRNGVSADAELSKAA